MFQSPLGVLRITQVVSVLLGSNSELGTFLMDANIELQYTAKGGSVISWAEAYDKAYHLVSRMTLVEKGLSLHFQLAHLKPKILT